MTSCARRGSGAVSVAGNLGDYECELPRCGLAYCCRLSWIDPEEVPVRILPGMGRHIVFKCPQTSMNVQHWLADTTDDAKDAYVPVVCQACTKLHFINSSTGNLLGEAEK